MQAAMMLVSFETIETDQVRRLEIASYYCKRFENLVGSP
jgi:hypothetical protein